MLARTPIAHIPILFDVFVTLLMFFGAAGLGRFLLRALRVEVANDMERGLFSAALGLGALSFIPFFLFAVRLGAPKYHIGALFLLCAAVWPDMARVGRGAVRAVKTGFLAWKAEPAWSRALAVVILPQIAVVFLSALCPATDGDGISYHLTAPLRYLSAGRFYYLPTYLHTNWPLGVEMLFAMGLAFSRLYASGLVQFGFGILLMMATVALGRRFGSVGAGRLAAILLFFGIRGEMSWSYIDLGLAFATLMSLFAVAEGMKREGPQRAAYWRLAAILAGVSATTKLPGLLTVAIIAGMMFATKLREAKEAGDGENSIGAALRPAIECIGIGLLVALPWFLRCWAMTGDPVYPYFYSIFHPIDWDAAAARRLTTYFQDFNTLRTLNLTPLQVREVRAGACLATLLIGVPLTLRAKAMRPLVAFVVAFVFLQIATSGIYARYFLPVYAIGALLPFLALRRALGKPAVGWALTVAATGAVWGYLWGLKAFINQGKAAVKQVKVAFPVAIGKVKTGDYLAHHHPAFALCNDINAMQIGGAWVVSPEATVVLATWDGFSAYVDRRTLITNIWTQDVLRFDSLERLTEDMKREHVAYVVMRPDSMNVKTPLNKIPREDRVRFTTEFPMMEKFVATYGFEKAYTDSGYHLYEITYPQPGAPHK